MTELESKTIKVNIEPTPGYIAREFFDGLPLPSRSANLPLGELSQSIKYAQRRKLPLIIVSSICPPYSCDKLGRPTYEGLDAGISPNIERHFIHIPSKIERLRQRGIEAVHFFLMADTEVDLLPFLRKIKLTPAGFIARCQESVDIITQRVASVYGTEVYRANNIPPATRFLDYFGSESWYSKYHQFQTRLIEEVRNQPDGRISRGLEHDLNERSVLIEKLLGRVEHEEQIAHLARQRAQYMAFGSLMRERFGQRLVVVNHRTPNFAWMNDRITREPSDPEKLAKRNFEQSIPLVELDISSLPN